MAAHSGAEAFPTASAIPASVLKACLEQTIPRDGIVEAMDSDRGTHFTGMTLQAVLAALGTQWDLQTPWHPQSSGQVQRINGEIKKPSEAAERNQDATGTAAAIGFGKKKSQTQGRYSIISPGTDVCNSSRW